MIRFMFCLFSNPGLDQLSSVGRTAIFHVINEYGKKKKENLSLYLTKENLCIFTHIVIQIGIASSFFLGRLFSGHVMYVR